MRSRTLALAAGFIAIVAIAATPMPAAAWCSHDRQMDCDPDPDVVVVEPDVVIVDPGFDHHSHRHFHESQFQTFPGTQPYWGQMRPYWGPNEPPGVIHRQDRTPGIRIRRAK
jgi:hypothetical protein